MIALPTEGLRLRAPRRPGGDEALSLRAFGVGVQSWHEPSGTAAGPAGPAADPLPVFQPAALFVQQRGRPFTHETDISLSSLNLPVNI